jgi:hypothetical protein
MRLPATKFETSFYVEWMPQTYTCPKFGDRPLPKRDSVDSLLLDTLSLAWSQKTFSRLGHLRHVGQGGSYSQALHTVYFPHYEYVLLARRCTVRTVGAKSTYSFHFFTCRGYLRHVPGLGRPKTEGASQVHRDSTGTHHHQANSDTADPGSCNCPIYGNIQRFFGKLYHESSPVD